MIVSSCQRWRDRRDTYRPAGEVFNPRGWEVAPLAEGDAKAFVVAHHYSHTYPAARERFGLFAPGGALSGVVVFSEPMTRRSFTLAMLPEDGSVECGRLVLLDEVRANGESWFIGRAFDLLRARGYAAVLSMADPVPRTDADGRVVHPGHIGTIYQATNGAYLGRASSKTLHLFPDGTVFSARAIQKIRAQERGHRYAEDQLVAAGAVPRGSYDPRAWLRFWLPRLTRTLRHGGNHRYAWWLNRRRHQVSLKIWQEEGMLASYPKVTISR